MSNAGDSGEITVSHLLLGIWSEKESAGHKILVSLGFDDEKAKELSVSVSIKLDFALERKYLFRALIEFLFCADGQGLCS